MPPGLAMLGFIVTLRFDGQRDITQGERQIHQSLSKGFRVPPSPKAC